MKQYAVIGKGLPAKDALDKVMGQARYGTDISLQGQLHGRILRSPYPHAKILDIDTSKAEALPGVKAVITARDVPLRDRSPYASRPPIEKRVFASDKVRFVGDEVAAVAAVDSDRAQEALELIRVEYEPLPAVLTPLDALRPDCPRIHEEEDNLCTKFQINRGDVQQAFRESDHVFEDTVHTQIQYQAYLEPVACVASFDASGKLTVWMSSMDPSGMRSCLAEALQLSETKIRVVHTFVGGAFGGKIGFIPLYPICALLAKHAGKPVKLVYSREEDFIATLPRLAASIDIKTAFRKDGTLLAKESRILADTGAYRTWAWGIVGNMATLPDTVYRIPNVTAEARIVYTNKTPPGPFRGFGNPQMNFAMETHLDRVADLLGIDPMELRLKNFTQCGDTTTHGFRIGSCKLPECVDVVAGTAHWEKKQMHGQHAHGSGMACGAFHCDARIKNDFCGSVAFVQINEDGKCKVISGEADCGQGWTTVAAQIAAEEIGLPYEDVEVTTPDTDVTPYSEGPWGLRITVSGGNAIKLAASEAKRQLLQVASELLEASVADLEVVDRQVRVKGSPEKALAISKIAGTAIFRRGGSVILGKGVDEPDTVFRDHTLYGNYTRAFAFTSQVAQVEIDSETGQVEISRLDSAYDIGQPVNPMSVEGQMQGSWLTGLGYALTEEVRYAGGTVLNPSFLDYKVPTATDTPTMGGVSVDSEDPNTPFGLKAAGNLGIVTPAPAVANALRQVLGVKVDRLPVLPEQVLSSVGDTGASRR